jgi:hypothetical protein
MIEEFIFNFSLLLKIEYQEEMLIFHNIEGKPDNMNVAKC